MQMVSTREHAYIRQNRVYIKKYCKRQRRTLYKNKRSTSQEDITFINIYAPNSRTPEYMKQTLIALKGKIKSNTIIIGDFNTHFNI